VAWTAEQNTVVQKILRRARHGERVVFIPGNHDEVLRDYLGITLGDIEVVGECVHQLADGRRFLLLHGDEFDQITRHHRWVALLGDAMYDALVRLNSIIAFVRRRCGMRCYWSLAGYAKRRVKSALQFIFDFEQSASRAARQRGLDGVICGHIHSATIAEIDGVVYVNCGDWVDSCTAIVEHLDGRLELIAWGSAVAVAQPTSEELACVS
jgi:UDP-2,3-diacylglucosamine pyrophosphatase LpxH